MLRRADAAVMARAGWPRRRTWFWPDGRTATPVRLGGRRYRALLAEQLRQPVAVVELDGRLYWLFRDRWYWETDGLAPDDVRALVLDAERRRSRRIERAHLLTGARGPGGPTEGDDEATPLRRTTIPDDVKTFVWQRDQGRCVACGSPGELEFDHVIPVALGGSDTARNLQLLCATCNRAKGPHLA